MPSIASHLAIAFKVAKKLKIKNDDYILGNMLPDILKGDNTHFKINGTFYEIPDIRYFIQNNKYNSNIFLGYLTHLLLDKHFLEEYVPSNIKNFNKIDLFSPKMIYNDYTNINVLLVNKYHINLRRVNKILKSNIPFELDKEKYNVNLTSINVAKSDIVNYIDLNSFYSFIDTMVDKIAKEIILLCGDDYEIKN